MWSLSTDPNGGSPGILRTLLPGSAWFRGLGGFWGCSTSPLLTAVRVRAWTGSRGISAGETPRGRTILQWLLPVTPVNPDTCLAYLFFSCRCVGAALKAAVVNCRACGARMLFNIMGGFHARTWRRGSGRRRAGNQCHLATCAGTAREEHERYQRCDQKLQIAGGLLGWEKEFSFLSPLFCNRFLSA